MLKLAVLILALAVSIALSTSLESKFGSERLLRLKSASKDGNICCLPKVYSIKMAQNEIIIDLTLNKTKVTSITEIRKDFKLGRVRIDVVETRDGITHSQTRWLLKVNSTTAVQYYMQNDSCDCSVEINDSDLNPTCFSSRNMIVSSAKIGQYDATRLVGVDEYFHDADIWLFREPQMNKETCWVLSYFASTTGPRKSISSEILSYDMIEKVDESYFKVPSPLCPAMNQCLLTRNK